MKTLKQLNNVEKAKLLHGWFPDEMGGYLDTMQGISTEITENREQHRQEWEQGFLPFDFWLTLAERAGELMRKYRRDLHKSNRVFSDHLFDGYQAIFSAHCLIAYAKKRQLDNRKFYLATDLLFDI